MKPLLFGIAALLVGLPSHSQTAPVQLETVPRQSGNVYLLVQSGDISATKGAIDMHSFPMQSFEQCELAGAKLMSSKRLKVRGAGIGFECIEGK